MPETELPVYYLDMVGQWRWRVEAANGKIIAASTEAYYNHDDAVANYNQVADLEQEDPDE